MASEPRPGLGLSSFADTEETPASAADFPMHTAFALAAAYVAGWAGWHWAYVVVLFWVLVNMALVSAHESNAILIRRARPWRPVRMDWRDHGSVAADRDTLK